MFMEYRLTGLWMQEREKKTAPPAEIRVQSSFWAVLAFNVSQAVLFLESHGAKTKHIRGII